MATKVGTKGQVVIAKEIRDRLGVEPGWIAIQRLVNNKVEISFVPPRHNKSAGGILGPFIKRRVDDHDWTRIREQAAMDAVREDWEAFEADEASAEAESEP